MEVVRVATLASLQLTVECLFRQHTMLSLRDGRNTG